MMIIFYNENMEFSKAAAALYLMFSKDASLMQRVPPPKVLENSDYVITPIYHKVFHEKIAGETKYYDIGTLNDLWRHLFKSEPPYQVKMISQYIEGRYSKQFSDKRTIMAFGANLLYLDVYMIANYFRMHEEDDSLHTFIERCADSWELFKMRDGSINDVRLYRKIKGKEIGFYYKKPETYHFPTHKMNADYLVDGKMVYVKLWADIKDLNVGLFAKQLGGYGWKNVGYFAMSIEKFEKLIK